MLNDVKPPPTQTPIPPEGLADPIHSHTHGHAQPHIDPKEPGLHHARVMGEATHVDPIYDTSVEDRGSNFSIGLTLTVVAIVVVVMLAILWSFYR